MTDPKNEKDSNDVNRDRASAPSSQPPMEDSEITPETGFGEEKPVEQILAEDNSRLQTELETIKDQFLRKVAEFDNYRKRTEREFSNLILNANEKLILEMLPIIDDLERSLKAIQESPETMNGTTFFQGVELIYNKLIKALETQGLEAMNPIGKEFDVNQHDALMQIESQEYPPHTVIDQHEKGYILNGKVIRHAKVIVSK
jgi:molecular chaperone GrpE